jgi:hypothetical protein
MTRKASASRISAAAIFRKGENLRITRALCAHNFARARN